MREMLIVSRSKVEQSTLDDLRDGWLGRRPIFGSKNGGRRRLRGNAYLYDRYLIAILFAFILHCCFFTYSPVVVCNGMHCFSTELVYDCCFCLVLLYFTVMVIIVVVRLSILLLLMLIVTLLFILIYACDLITKSYL